MSLYCSASRLLQFRRLHPFFATAICLSFLCVLLLSSCDMNTTGEEQSRLVVQRNRTAVRKLLLHDGGSPVRMPTVAPAAAPAAAAADKERMGDGGCSRDDVAVQQGETPPLPNGIPTYTVEILNVCVSGCAVSDVHVSCGWFSSARLVNPRVFRRVGFDDCLVNDGAALPPGGSLSFQYANTYRYPLYVSSLACSSTLP